MKRLLFCIAAAAALIAPLSGSAGRAGDRTAVAEAAQVTADPGVPVLLGGKELEFNPPAATVSGALFVPATRLAAALQVKEEYEGDSYAPMSLTASAEGTSLSFHVGSTEMSKNGRKVTLPSAPYIDDDFLYVPLRAFAEAFGYIVRWDDVKHAVVLEKERDALPAVGTDEKLKELLGTASGGVNGGIAVEKRIVAVTDQAVGAPVTASGESMAKAAADSKISNADYSGTNVQVAGVDEGDIVKTDGTYLYQVGGRTIAITRAVPGTDMKLEAEIALDERYMPTELYVDGDKLVVIGRSSRMTAKPVPETAPQAVPVPDAATEAKPAPDAAPAAVPSLQPRVGIKAGAEARIAAPNNMLLPYGKSLTKAVVYDIADREHPKLLRTVELDGNAVATRKVGPIVYLVANAPAYSYWRNQGDAPAAGPSYRDSAIGDAPKQIGLPDIRYFPGSVRPNVMLVGGFDLSRPEQPIAVSSFLGAGQEVYMSEKSLYVAAVQYGRATLAQPQAGQDASAAIARNAQPSTSVYRFTLDDGRVRYSAKGDVPGTVLNQFSMDEYDDTFRIATTMQDGSALYTLDQSMQTIGRLDKLAPGERIYSARFLGGRAYLVTFRQVDPLFVIDLFDPKQPALLGALKIPGYSDYLHPYDETHLIGFGKETATTGKGAVLTQGMKVSLFDVSDVSHPVELFKTTIGDRGTESELLKDHRALLFSREKDLLAFPVAVREIAASGGEANPSAYGPLAFQGAYVYKLDLTSGFRLQGRITHLNEQNSLKTGYDAYNPAYGVKRILYIGDTLYTVSDGAVQANALGTLQERGRLEIGK